MRILSHLWRRRFRLRSVVARASTPAASAVQPAFGPCRTSQFRRIAIIFPLLTAAVLMAQPSPIALRNARIVTVGGATLAKGTVLLRDGLIADVGADVKVPAEAWVIDAQGLTVYPGLVDALSTWGIGAGALPSSRTATTAAPITSSRRSTTSTEPVAHGPEERPATNSWLRAADLVSASDPRIVSGRNAGFTSAVTFPTTGIFGGQGALIDLSGDAKTMVVSTPVGQHLSLASASFSTYPGSLMGVIAYIRQVYLDAAHYRIERAAYEKNHAMRRPAYDRAVEGVLESPRALLPAESAVQLERMARFAAELKLNAILYGAQEAFRDAARLHEFGYPVLLNLKWPERLRDADPEARDSMRTLELREHAPESAAALAKAGVRFAFYTGGATARDSLRAVKRAIDAGLAPADALRAMTLSAAEMYGLGDRLGSIEKGKIANLVVTDGDLFQERTQVKYIFIDGKKFEPVPEAPAGERSGSGAMAGGEGPSPENPPLGGGTR